MCITKRKQKAQKSSVLAPKSTAAPTATPTPVTPAEVTKPAEKEKVAVAVAATVAEVVVKGKCGEGKESKEKAPRSTKKGAGAGGEVQDTQPDENKSAHEQATAIAAKAPDVSPPKVVHAKRAVEGLKEPKDPAYATLDDDFPPFEAARLRGTSRENSRKIEPTQISSNDDNRKELTNK